MNQVPQTHKRPAAAGVFLFLFLFLLAGTGCQKILEEIDSVVNNPKAQDFKQVNLLANNNMYGAANVDPRFINAWGIAFSAGGTPWINTTGTGLSFVTNSEGVVSTQRPPVVVPRGENGPPIGLPTGIVFNGSATAFMLPNGAPARFIFAGVDGVISGWNGPSGDNAVKMVDKSATSAYTGMAISRNEGKDYLYAANFRTGKIDVFDASFKEVTTMPFTDAYLPAGYAPFNIRALGDLLFVMYAQVGADGRDEPGQGKGYVNVFNTSGYLVLHFASRGALNAPWGVAGAPKGFFGEDDERKEDYRNAILVGNFGDGRINIYSRKGKYLGQLHNDEGDLIEIDGLWEITFPPSTAQNIDLHRLYFAAGPNHEEDGLFGYIIKE